MPKMTRSKFLHTAALGGMAGLFLPGSLQAWNGNGSAGDLIKGIGIQLFSLPKMLEADPKSTLKMLSDMGYSEIELYGPYPFSSESYKSYWKQLTPMLGFSGSGYFGLSQEAFRDVCRDFGLRIPSLHTDMDTLENHMGPLSEAANRIGATYVTLPSIPPDRRQDLEGYKKMADTFNRIGAEARRGGIRFAYHNHGYGLQAVDGIVPFDMMIGATDPDTVFLEMDIFWTTAAKADPAEYLRNYRNRYKMLHIKDMRELKYFAGDGGDPSQWIELFPYMASAGAGVLDLDTVLKAARESGVDHFFVEQDMVANPQLALRDSYNYLDSL